jgi:hypothetical protein
MEAVTMLRTLQFSLAVLALVMSLGFCPAAYGQTTGYSFVLGRTNGARLPPNVGGLSNRMPGPTLSQPGPFKTAAPQTSPVGGPGNAPFGQGPSGNFYGNMQAGPSLDQGMIYGSDVLGNSAPSTNIGGAGMSGTTQPSTTLRADVNAPPAVSSELTRRLAKSLAAAQSLSNGSKIAVAMDGTSIVLRGNVSSDNEKRVAEALVRLEPGVDSVRNELQVVANSQ